ncbi:MAG TPA: DUF3570 domain-containing protein [Gammaproteobacteria bacterium]|nr:DUF3570 domain-containing protein [Gammaproteobacteria bacterium]
MVLLAGGGGLPLLAAVLPEDKADVLYHFYDGGGVEIKGPAVQVRARLQPSTSVFGKYYVDAITSASIDVVTTASPYTEKRREQSVGIDYLRGKSLMSLSYTTSTENDFDARSAHFGLAQEFFGGLSTLSLGYSQGWDVVGKSGDEAFAEDVTRRHYRLGLSQVLSKSVLLDTQLEVITDEGFLNNPYRSVRYLDASVGKGFSYEPEVYPRTRTSTALAVRGAYYLPYRASLRGEYRFFTDTWGISAHTVGLSYTHPLGRHWILDGRYRFYSQSKADFYSDLFPYRSAQTHLARDKELSTYRSHSIGVGLAYEFQPGAVKWIDKGSFNLAADYIQFDYDDFRDLSGGGPVGEEPLYGFSAQVLQAYLSIWY